MYWINPVSYTLYGLVVGQLGDVTELMQASVACDPVHTESLALAGCASTCT